MKEGYKKTELGLMPENWKVLKLGAFGSFKNGINKAKEDFGFGYPFINLLDVFGKSIVNSIGLSLVNVSIREMKDYDLRKGDVLFVRSSVKPSGVGLTALITRNLHETVFSGFLIRFRDKGELFTDYKRYCFYERDFRKRLINHSSISANTNINQNALENLLIQIPTLPEQQKIAEILSTVDEKIDVIEELIKETHQLKKGLIQSLLTKGIGHTKFKNSSFGVIPENWELIKLASVTNKIGDGIHSTPNYVEKSSYFFINGNNLSIGKIFITEKTKCVNESEFNKLKQELDNKTILLSINGTIGNMAFYNNENVILGKSVAYITCKDVLNKNFLFYLLQTEFVTKYFYNELTGSTISNLSLKSIRNTLIPLPSKEEQQKIANILISVEKKLEVIQGKKTQYNQLKKGLMQQLLTGKIRVNNLIYQTA